jgi:hypothetical protein
MTQSASEFSFRETMSGPLTLGEAEPLAGAGKGRHTPFTFHATISIDDMEGFLRDPQHAARLEGRISYPPLGEDLPVKRGSFNLFKGSDTPGTRLMTYGMAFEVDGREYFLEGTKTIRDEKGFDLWHDTTRLYCHLHEGSHESGRVVGAGVLKLGVRDVLNIVRSMQSERRQGMQEVEAIGKFGRFFLGTLWDVYAPLAREAQAPSGTEAPSAP